VTDWRERVDRLLYDGERVLESAAVAGDRVVVTTHRVLALTPNGDGANFRAVDLPNVEGIRVSTDGTRRYLRWTIRPLVLGAVLVLAGTRLDIGDPLSGMDTSSAEATGTGGILSTVSSLTSLLAALDEVMLAVGAGCLLVVALLLGLYLHSRQRRLVVGVAGDDDLKLPVDAGQESAATRLEAAVAEATAADESPSAPGDTHDGGDRESDDGPTTVEDVFGAETDTRTAGDATGDGSTSPPSADDEPK